MLNIFSFLIDTPHPRTSAFQDINTAETVCFCIFLYCNLENILKSKKTDAPMLQHGTKSRANYLLKIPVTVTLTSVYFSTQSCGYLLQDRKKLDGEADKQVQSLFLYFKSRLRSFIKSSKCLEL